LWEKREREREREREKERDCGKLEQDEGGHTSCLGLIAQKGVRCGRRRRRRSRD
jgi:hypothetical protein